VQTTRLHLPFPAAIPIIFATLALLGAVVYVLPAARTRLTRIPSRFKQASMGPVLMAILAVIVILAPTFLVALAVTPLMSEQLLTCRASTHWSMLFQHKDAATVRAIQNALRCCGFNSPHDRAWPFPSAHGGTDARTCERTSGFGQRSCGRLVEQQLRSVAAADVVAGIVLQLLEVRFDPHDWPL
jgi:hypothetical protein